MTHEQEDGTKVTEGGHDEVRQINCEEFADHGMSCLFGERT